MTLQQIQHVLFEEFIISSDNIDNCKGNGLGYPIISDLLKRKDASISIQVKNGYRCFTIHPVKEPVKRKASS